MGAARRANPSSVPREPRCGRRWLPVRSARPTRERKRLLKRALISVAVTTAAVSMTAAPAMAATLPKAVHHVRTYQVRRDDTYWAISHRYGVTMQDLAAFNHANLWGTLYAGTVLRIPP
ncbi:LysM peptidoglycan-binding domain-containing protein, partial [Acidimicrobiaceae bacterium USS-CC1]|nr:LysM peptidoglycan-binding domain-containing protein [Acidiferrimicrobium australe]